MGNDSLNKLQVLCSHFQRRSESYQKHSLPARVHRVHGLVRHMHTQIRDDLPPENVDEIKRSFSKCVTGNKKKKPNLSLCTSHCNHMQFT